MKHDVHDQSPTLAFILKGYPRLSETFIAQEIKALEDRGLSLHLYALREPTDTLTHPIHTEIKAPVTYLPEYTHAHPLRFLKAWMKVRTLKGYPLALQKLRQDLRNDFTRSRLRRFAQACVLAAELPPSISHLHAHFLHTPASVTRYAATLLGLPWSASAHAKDIWTQCPQELRLKLTESSWVTTCSAHAHTYLQSLAVDPFKIHLIYHGLDLSRFPIPTKTKAPASPFRILSVGRLVEKKGYAILLQALHALPTHLDWHFTHIGGGPLKETLYTLASALGLTNRITWLGPQSQTTVLEAYRNADIFVLPSLQTVEGDQDGLPNVLLEAQSQGLMCLSTTLSAIPELIDHGVTGLLVPPKDANALAASLNWAAQHPAERTSMGQKGQDKVRTQFTMETGITNLYNLFRRPQ